MSTSVKRAKLKQRTKLSRLFRTLPGTGNVWVREVDAYGVPTAINNPFWHMRARNIFGRENW